MKIIVAVLMLLAVVALLLPAPAAAANPSLLSLARLSIAVGPEREVLRTATDAVPAVKLEEQRLWSGVVALAYNILSPEAGTSGLRVSLTARVAQPFDTAAKPNGVIGLRVTLFQGAK